MNEELMAKLVKAQLDETITNFDSTEDSMEETRKYFQEWWEKHEAPADPPS